MDPLSTLRTPTGARVGKEILASRIQSWLRDERVLRLHIQSAPSTPIEVALVFKQIPSLSPYGLAKVILWLTRRRVVRLAICRSEIAIGRKRRAVKEELKGLREWAEEQTRDHAGLILPN